VSVDLIEQDQQMIARMGIDWGSDVAVPDQIAGILRAEIAAGKPAKGATLPSLIELAERFDVSTGTITRALRVLRSEGIVGGRGSRGLVVLRRPKS
jgi:DNA-binding GntR family transcriptional regulator